MSVLKLRHSSGKFSVTPPLTVTPRKNERLVNLCHFQLEDDLKQLRDLLQQQNVRIDRIVVQGPLPYNIFSVLENLLYEICEDIEYE
jgi:hypothetical protein